MMKLLLNEEIDRKVKLVRNLLVVNELNYESIDNRKYNNSTWTLLKENELKRFNNQIINDTDDER